MSMELTFLGTGSAYPSPHRGASALVLRTDGESWMFDCGEGTQTQLMKSQLRAAPDQNEFETSALETLHSLTGTHKVRLWPDFYNVFSNLEKGRRNKLLHFGGCLDPGRITKVFISHLHGDHVFGLPGLLCTVSLNLPPEPKRLQCVDIYGPRGLRHFLRVTLGLTASQLVFPYAVHELEPTSDQSPEGGQSSREDTAEHGCLLPQEQEGRNILLDPGSDTYLLFEDSHFEVRAFRLFHRVPSFGFCVQEKDRPGRLRTELLKELGVKPGPMYGRLKSGESLTLDCGRVLTPGEVLEEDIPGRKVCVLGDCSSVLGQAPLRLCCGADILVHEATLGDEQREKAVEHGHSTPKMAAALARECQVRTLVLYHFSQRYKPPALQKEGEGDDVCELKRQAEEVLQGTGIEVMLAEDFFSVSIPLKKPR